MKKFSRLALFLISECRSQYGKILDFPLRSLISMRSLTLRLFAIFLALAGIRTLPAQIGGGNTNPRVYNPPTSPTDDAESDYDSGNEDDAGSDAPRRPESLREGGSESCDDDKCEDEDSGGDDDQLHSVDVRFPLAAIPSEPLIGSGALQLYLPIPVDNMADPKLLDYASVATMEIVPPKEEPEPNAPFTCGIKQGSGKIIHFKPNSGDSVGKPTGHEAQSRARICFYTNGNPTTTPESATTIRQYRSAGGFVDFDKLTGKALRHVSRSGRETSFQPSLVEIIRNGEKMRQVKTAAGLLDVVADSGERSYVVKTYEPSQIGPKVGQVYTLISGAKPKTSVTVSHTEGTDIVIVTTVRYSNGTQPNHTHVSTYEYKKNNFGSADWVQTTNTEGVIIETRREVAPNLSIKGMRNITRTVVDKTGTAKELLRNTVVQKYVEAWQGWANLSNVEEVTINGARSTLNRTFGYYENPNELGFGLPQIQGTSNGNYYTYQYDASGRIIKRESPWVGGGNLTEAYSYSPHTGLDEVLPGDERPRTTTLSVDGKVIGKTYFAAFVNGGGEYTMVEERAATQGSGYGDPANFKKITTYYSANHSDAFVRGKLKEVVGEGGVVTEVNHTSNGANGWSETVISPLTPSYGKVDGSTQRVISTYDTLGRLLTVRTAVWDGAGFLDLKEARNTYAVTGHAISTVEKDLVSNRERVTSIFDWKGLQLVSHTQADGSTTNFSYDGYGRATGALKLGVNGVASPLGSGNYPTIPGQGVLHTGAAAYFTSGGVGWANQNTTRSAGSVSLTSSRSFDGRGNLTSETAEDGYITSFATDSKEVHQTITSPTGAVLDVYKHVDGRVQTVTGKGVVPRFYSYSVDSSGNLIVAERLGNKTSTRYTTRTTDLLGRLVSESSPSPAPGGGMVVKTYAYQPGTFRPVKVTSSAPNTPAQIIQYDAIGRVERSGANVTSASALSPTQESDRIRETTRDVVQDGNGIWSVTASYTYPEIGANAGQRFLLGETRTKLAGFSGDFISDESTTNAAGVTSRMWSEQNQSSRLFVGHATVSTVSGESTAVYLDGRLMELRTPDNSQSTLYSYDGMGRPTATQLPGTTQASQIAYVTGKNLVASVTDASGATTSYEYGAQGTTGARKAVKLTRPDLTTIRTEYNLFGQETRRWGSGTAPLQMAYDTFGQMTHLFTYRAAVVGANDNAATWQHGETDSVTYWERDFNTGLVKAKHDAAGKKVQYAYDAMGRLSQRTSARGIVTTYGYSSFGQNDSITYSNEPVGVTTAPVGMNYDRLGRASGMAQGVISGEYNSWSYEYGHRNGQGALISLKRSKETVRYGVNSANPLVRSFERSLDTAARDSGWNLMNGATVEHSTGYAYDALSRLVGVSGKDVPNLSSRNYAFEYAWQANSSSSRLEYVTGPVHTVDNTWDVHRGFLTDKKNLVGGSAVSRFQYTPDVMNRRDTATVSGSAFSAAFTWDWGYNTRGEVIAADHSSNSAFDRGYFFDGIGNRLKSINGNTDTSAAGALTYTANALNQYETITNVPNPVHDFDGNLNSGALPVAPTAAASMVWDSENRLIKITKADSSVIEYSYDPLGRRIAKKVGSQTTATIYDNWNPVAEYVSSGSSFSISQSFVWGRDLSGSLQGAGGVGGLLAVRNHSVAATFYPTYDGNGNVSEYLNTVGAAVAHYEYDAFGLTLVASGAHESLFAHRFSTKIEDAESGLYYYGYRYYDVSSGRWMSRDPIDERGGFNLYGFIKGDGINRVDCFGLIDGGVGFDCMARLALNEEELKHYDHERVEQGKGVLIDAPKEAANAVVHSNPFVMANDIGEQQGAASHDPEGYIEAWAESFVQEMQRLTMTSRGQTQLLTQLAMGSLLPKSPAKGATRAEKSVLKAEASVPNAAVIDAQIGVEVIEQLANGKKCKTGKVNPAKLRWSQTTAGGKGRAAVYRKSIGENGWKEGEFIDVVETADGLVTVDHTRAAIALELGIEEIPARFHLPDDPLPSDMLTRPWNGAGETATTWGEAIEKRGAGQNPPIGPTGSPTPPKLPQDKK